MPRDKRIDVRQVAKTIEDAAIWLDSHDPDSCKTLDEVANWLISVPSEYRQAVSLLTGDKSLLDPQVMQGAFAASLESGISGLNKNLKMR